MVTLEIINRSDTIEALSLYVLEQVSYPTRCIITVPFFEEATSLSGLLATIKLEIDEGKDECFRGYIIRIGLERETVELETLSWAALLSRSVGSRVFEHQSLHQIIRTVLEKCPVESSIEAKDVSMDLSIQFNETDFNYLNRILEYCGVFYFFREDGKKTEWIFSDNNSVFLAGKKVVPQQIEQLKKILSWLPGKYRLKGLKGNRAESRLEEGDPDFIINDEISQPSEPDTIAITRQRELALSALEIEGESVCEHIRTGRKITLNDTDVLITKVEHQWISAGGYSNMFHGVPGDVMVVPVRETVVPDLTGIYIAKVIGDTEGIADLDSQGRVRIDFEWASESPDSLTSQCWVSVTHLWSGKNNSVQFFPRVGDKVSICFENGDPNRPTIVGSVAETEKPLMEGLGEKNLISGILTKSANGRRNGWIINEEEANETLTIIADNEMDVNAEKRTTIIKTHDKTTVQEGDLSVEIQQGNLLINVGKGDVTIKGKNVNIEAQNTISLKNGAVSLTLTENGTVEVG
jgi:type VI secretion system secreted protein VgrG